MISFFVALGSRRNAIAVTKGESAARRVCQLLQQFYQFFLHQRSWMKFQPQRSHFRQSGFGQMLQIL
jgi:hypothetical protein